MKNYLFPPSCPVKPSKFNCMKEMAFLLIVFLFSQNKIIAQWDETTNLPNITAPAGTNVGIGFTSGAALLARLHLQNNDLRKGFEAASSSTGLLLANNTEATSTHQTQSSPPIVLVGHGYKPASGGNPAVDRLLDFKIDVSNTSTPFGGGQVLWGPDYSAFRIQRRFASTDGYSDFFSVTGKIDATSDITLRLGQIKTISNNSGATIIHGTNASGGTIGFYNQATNVIYGRLLTEGTNAGNFTIGGNPPAADPSALLQLESTSRGLLLPRMTSTERNAIASPAEGLVVYDKSTGAKSPYYYDGTKWNKLAGSGNPNVIYVSPLQFGAYFDGIHDDIDALDATYAYCKSLPYDKQVIIQMPPGVCRITRPWVIGTRFVDEQYCFFNMYPSYGRGYPQTYNSTQAILAAQSKMVSIEGSGSTALYLDFTDDQSIQAGIYYSAYSNSAASLELRNSHITGIGIYGKGYFTANSTSPAARRARYASHNNKQIGILAPTPSSIRIENCTFRDLKEGLVINNSGAVIFKNSFITSCQRGYYCWGAHGSIIENVTVDQTETGFEIRSGSMTVNNIYARFCPVSLWVHSGTNTFNGCYFECGNYATAGSAQLIIGDDPGDLIPTEFPTANFNADAINFNSLTIAAFSPAGTKEEPTAFSLWMKKSARRVAIRGGYLQSSFKKFTPESSNELVLQGVAGMFTDVDIYGHPTGNQNLTGRVSVQDNDAIFKTMKLTNLSTTSETGLRPLFVDQAGNIVVAP